MTNDDERGEGGKKCRKFDDVICERPLKMYFCKGNIRWIEKMDLNNRNWKGKGHFIKEVGT